ncbi:MAG: RNA methyltransferase [Christensenellales bacterium]|nr:RNA methyltransferase [Christensenellales bacterium]
MHETRYLLVGATKWLVHRALPVILDLFSASLSRKKVNDRINFDINIEALPDRVSKTATYAEIKAYVLEHYGLKVSSLYIAQIKEKHGIKERENYNIGEGKSKELICPPEKEEAITNALKHFNMI